jgi:hypothetical protein
LGDRSEQEGRARPQVRQPPSCKTALTDLSNACRIQRPFYPQKWIRDRSSKPTTPKLTDVANYIELCHAYLSDCFVI